MEMTLFIAQVMGVFFTVVGVGILLNPMRMKNAMEEVKRNYLFPYFGGVTALFIGLLIVLNHNVWDGLLESLVSLVGWLSILKGVFMILLPQKTVSAMMEKFMGTQMTRFMGVVAVVLGLYFVYQGFLL